jgi:hypothetical protein
MKQKQFGFGKVKQSKRKYIKKEHPTLTSKFFDKVEKMQTDDSDYETFRYNGKVYTITKEVTFILEQDGEFIDSHYIIAGIGSD